MRNRWDKAIYDQYGDRPEVQGDCFTKEMMYESFRPMGITESRWAQELEQFDALVDERMIETGPAKTSMWGLCRGIIIQSSLDFATILS